MYLLRRYNADFMGGQEREFSLHVRQQHLLNFSVDISVLPSCNLSCLLSLPFFPLMAPQPHPWVHAFQHQLVRRTSKRETLTSPSCVGQVLDLLASVFNRIPILITADDKVIFKSVHCKLFDGRNSSISLSPTVPNKNAV